MCIHNHIHNHIHDHLHDHLHNHNYTFVYIIVLIIILRYIIHTHKYLLRAHALTEMYIDAHICVHEPSCLRTVVSLKTKRLIFCRKCRTAMKCGVCRCPLWTAPILLHRTPLSGGTVHMLLCALEGHEPGRHTDVVFPHEPLIGNQGWPHGLTGKAVMRQRGLRWLLPSTAGSHWEEPTNHGDTNFGVGIGVEKAAGITPRKFTSRCLWTGRLFANYFDPCRLVLSCRVLSCP